MTGHIQLPPLVPLPFDDVRDRANIYTDRNRTETFGRLVLAAVMDRGGQARVLDVGCGAGLSVNDDNGAEALRDIRNAAGELWGCEPDPSIVPHALLNHFVRGTLEDADLPSAYFDVVYSHYVVEHVANPAAFMEKAARVMRPGGTLIFMTPNARHYFVKVARIVAALHLEEAVLKRIHKRGAEVHYPTRYLMNEPRDIERAARAAGFIECEFAWFEHGDLRDYFPGPFKLVPIVLERALRALGRDKLPGMVVRLTR